MENNKDLMDAIDNGAVPAGASKPIEAYGNKGFKNAPWRKTFKNAEKMLLWAEKNDATILGTREAE